MGSRQKFARRFTEGIEKLAGNAKGDCRREDRKTCHKINRGYRNMREVSQLGPSDDQLNERIGFGRSERRRRQRWRNEEERVGAGARGVPAAGWRRRRRAESPAAVLGRVPPPRSSRFRIRRSGERESKQDGVSGHSTGGGRQLLRSRESQAWSHNLTPKHSNISVNMDTQSSICGILS
ncbi:hypothetical protein BHM03_00046179 [Ensete ventricosum]|nr:hypothetical protein BHM03_00046179 [Ensete ventricosum]